MAAEGHSFSNPRGWIFGNVLVWSVFFGLVFLSNKTFEAVARAYATTRPNAFDALALVSLAAFVGVAIWIGRAKPPPNRAKSMFQGGLMGLCAMYGVVGWTSFYIAYHGDPKEAQAMARIYDHHEEIRRAIEREDRKAERIRKDREGGRR